MEDQKLPQDAQNEQVKEQSEKKVGLLKTLILLRIGIAEVILLTVAVIVALAVLNYFNIFSISSIFPDQLGFLPRKNNDLMLKQQSNKTIVPIALSPKNSSKQTAKEALINFLPLVVNPVFLPEDGSKVSLFEDKEDKQKFTGVVSVNEISGSASFFVSSDSKKILSVSVVFPYKTIDKGSIALAKKITPLYFVNEPKGEWSCGFLPNSAVFCENFWEEENGLKRGVGIQGNNPKSTSQKMSVFFCEHTKESSFYSWKSCAFEFSEKGAR